MSEKLQITLDEEATRKYLDWASAISTAEVDEDMEPSGCTITVKINGPYPSSAGCNINGKYYEFGEADVDII